MKKNKLKLIKNKSREEFKNINMKEKVFKDKRKYTRKKKHKKDPNF